MELICPRSGWNRDSNFKETGAPRETFETWNSGTKMRAFKVLVSSISASSVPESTIVPTLSCNAGVTTKPEIGLRTSSAAFWCDAES